MPQDSKATGTRRIPRRVPHRVLFFEGLWTAIELDALATVDDLRASGWTEAAIADAIDGYRRWLEANIADAVELGRIAGGVTA